MSRPKKQTLEVRRDDLNFVHDAIKKLLPSQKVESADYAYTDMALTRVELMLGTPATVATRTKPKPKNAEPIQG